MHCDKNKDGYITVKELKESTNNLMSLQEIEKIVNSIDVDNNGAINYTEYIAACLDQKILNNKEKLLDAFKTFDQDGDGVIDEAEIRKALIGDNGVQMDAEVFEEVLQEADKDGDGKVDINEFMDMMVNKS